MKTLKKIKKKITEDWFEVLEKYENKEFKMYKVLNEGGLFTSRTTEHIRVSGIENAVIKNTEGYEFAKYQDDFANLALDCYRALKKLNLTQLK